jgi:hypothetical protein
MHKPHPILTGPCSCRDLDALLDDECHGALKLEWFAMLIFGVLIVCELTSHMHASIIFC